MHLLKMSGSQIWLCLFTNLALFIYVSTHCVETVKWLDYNLLLCFTFLSKNTLFVTKVCNSFYKVNLFSILNMLQDL